MGIFADNTAKGLCGHCGKINNNAISLCNNCRDVQRKSGRKHVKKIRTQGKCPLCKVRMADKGMKTCIRCRVLRKEYYYKIAKIKRQNHKKQVLDFYGHKCNCCGIDGSDLFLTIDHMDNNGGQHRKDIGNNKIYQWIIENKFPNNFQTLCWTCNMAKYLNSGVCPHKNGV